VSLGGIGRVGGGPSADLAPLEGFQPFEALDELEAADTSAVVSVRTIEDALAAPSSEHLGHTLDPARLSEALTRVVRRGGRPGESVQEQRMRALVARLLDLRHEVASGMGKVSVG
jgi:hypothetical protein